MRLYEVVYILDPALDEAAVETKLDTFHSLVTGSTGRVEVLDHWGSRQLAYPVNGQKMGYYAVAQFIADPENLPEFERLLKLDDEVMRYLMVLNEGEPTSGLSILAETPPGDRDEEEDEDDADDDVEEDDDEDDDSPPEFQGGRGRARRHEGPRIELLNYKDVATLSRFMTEHGKILPKRTTKVSARFQRQLGKAVKRARYLALIPYIRDHEA